MRWMIVGLAVVAGSGAAAETLRCQSQGYCTLDRECFSDESVMRVDVNPDGSARYGWIQDEMYWFEAPGTRKGGMRIWVTPANEEFTQTLAITDAGEGTFQIVTEFEGMFYASMQVLSCTGKG